MTTKQSLSRNTLSRARILEAAFQIVDADNMHELTTSRLGRALGANPSAVYRHFRSMDELYLAMADVMLQEVADSVEVAEEPIENLRRVSWALRTSYLRRPGLARAVGARFTGGSAEATLVLAMIASVESLGFDRAQAIARTRALAEMVLGHILMTADMLSLTSRQQAFDLGMARSYYSAPFQPTVPLPPEEQLAATRADGDAVFDTMLETLLLGLTAEQPTQHGPARPSAEKG